MTPSTGGVTRVVRRAVHILIKNRDDKRTGILQSSLGGTAKTVVDGLLTLGVQQFSRHHKENERTSSDGGGDAERDEAWHPGFLRTEMKSSR